ncbi:MAG TPA: S41 family peptidase [Candidatus Obscuribacterales bacterium]
MQQHLKRAGLLILGVALAIIVCLPYKAKGSNTEPQQLYQRAWQLVRDNFYDTDFNHQDWEIWHHKYDGKLQTDAQAYEAIRAMLGSLDDPYTRFLDPKAFREEDDAINSFVCGIGISLRPWQQTHALIVNDVIEGGPAAHAGIEYGDEIVAIDGQPTTDVNTEQAADKIRGAAGTDVNLKIKHGTATHDCKITRAQVCIPSVSTKVLDHNIGYIKLATFMSDDASAEFRSALQRLSGTNGLIIDLRNNPGGLLANAVEIAQMLMDQGKIVSTASRHGCNTDACTGTAITNAPIVLLVDHDSASASEILAGALKDNRRATIVGTKTYGKGLVQEINRLPNGSGMHITVARYYTPNGSDINKIGIQPDVTVEDHDQQLAKCVNVLQDTMAHAPNRTAPDGLSPWRRSGYGYYGPRAVSPRS